MRMNSVTSEWLLFWKNRHSHSRVTFLVIGRCKRFLCVLLIRSFRRPGMKCHIPHRALKKKGPFFKPLRTEFILPRHVGHLHCYRGGCNSCSWMWFSGVTGCDFQKIKLFVPTYVYNNTWCVWYKGIIKASYTLLHFSMMLSTTIRGKT